MSRAVVSRRFQADPYLSHIAVWLHQTGRALKPDLDMAERFLIRLDREAVHFSFRTFSDTPYTRLKGIDPLESAIHGNLDGCWQELMKLNQAGAAIAVTINQTSGRVRSAQEIVQVRALFLDDDRGMEPGSFPLPPHLRVMTSKQHNHYYWLVRGLELEDFSRQQSRLAAYYAGDHRVCALNQAMQLPGFWRRKRVTNPIMPRFDLLHEGEPYSPSQLQNLFIKTSTE
jgi:hypothetical protein